MLNVQRIDKARFIGSIKRDDSGALRGTAVVARAGILTYFENGKMVKELIRPEELAKADSLETLKMKPVTLDHPSVKLVTPQTYKQFSVGLTGETVNCDEGLLYSSMTVNDSTAIQAVDSGKRELSCGYTCDLLEKPGTWTNGERYDREQVNRKYNHVAICDLGRAGSVASLHLDAADVYECGEPMYKNDGGEGSGNFGHNGRPGEQGGSGSGKGSEHYRPEVYGTLANINMSRFKDGKIGDLDTPDGPVSFGKMNGKLVYGSNKIELSTNHLWDVESKIKSGEIKYHHDSIKIDNQPSQRSRPMPVPVTLKGIVYNDQAPEVAAALTEALATIETVRKDTASVQTKLDAETAAHVATKAKLDAANAEIAAMPTKIAAASKARAELVATAKPHLDKADADKIDSLSDAQIKLAVANKAFPAAKETLAAVKVDNAESVDTWYTAALTTLKNDATDYAAAANRVAVNGTPKNDSADGKNQHVDSQVEWRHVAHDRFAWLR